MKKLKEKTKNPDAQALGHLGGLAVLKKIGKRGMKELGKKGALIRWNNQKGRKGTK